MKMAKKLFFISMFSLFALSAFSAPNGGGRGGSGRASPSAGRENGRGGAQASRSGPASRNEPKSSGRDAPKGGASAPKDSKSPNGGNPADAGRNPPKDSKSPSENEKNPPAPANPANSANPNPAEIAPNGSDSGQIRAEDVLYYRGTRILSENDTFALQNVKTERLDSNTVTLEISFNQSVNPHTFTADSILVDGKALSSKTKFSFNKKGDTIRLSIPAKNESFSLKIQDVESYDGTPLGGIAPITVKIE